MDESPYRILYEFTPSCCVRTIFQIVQPVLAGAIVCKSTSKTVKDRRQRARNLRDRYAARVFGHRFIADFQH